MALNLSYAPLPPVLLCLMLLYYVLRNLFYALRIDYSHLHGYNNIGVITVPIKFKLKVILAQKGMTQK